MSKKAFVEFPSGLKLPKELLRAALGACFIFVLFGVYLFLRAYSSRDDVPEQAEQADIDAAQDAQGAWCAEHEPPWVAALIADAVRREREKGMESTKAFLALVQHAHHPTETDR